MRHTRIFFCLVGPSSGRCRNCLQTLLQKHYNFVTSRVLLLISAGRLLFVLVGNKKYYNHLTVHTTRDFRVSDYTSIYCKSRFITALASNNLSIPYCLLYFTLLALHVCSKNDSCRRNKCRMLSKMHVKVCNVC